MFATTCMLYRPCMTEASMSHAQDKYARILDKLGLQTASEASGLKPELVEFFALHLTLGINVLLIARILDKLGLQTASEASGLKPELVEFLALS